MSIRKNVYDVEPLQIYVAADHGYHGHLMLWHSAGSAITIPFTPDGFYNRQIGNEIDTYKLTQVRYYFVPSDKLPSWIPQSIINISQKNISGYSYAQEMVCHISTLDNLVSAILYDYRITLDGGK